MVVKRKSDGKIIEVEPTIVGYTDKGYTMFYFPSDLDFDVEEAEQTDSDLRISVAHLREVLENRIPPYSDPKYVVAEVDLIIEQVKKEI